MKILISGAAGMLGHALIDALAGHELTGMGRREQGNLRISYVRGDVSLEDSMAEILKATAPEVVIHAAAWTDVDGCERDPETARRINTEGTRQIFEASYGVDAFFVFLSTDYVFDGGQTIPYTENDSPRPLNVYGKSKWDGENLIRESGHPHLIIRTSWLYGSRGKNFVDTILNLSEKRKTLEIVDDQKGRPTYTVDLARAIGKLLAVYERSKSGQGDDVSGLVHVANRGEASWFDFAQEILSQSGISTVELKAIPTKPSQRPAERPTYSVLNLERYEGLVGESMRSWKDALRHYLGERRKAISQS